MPHSDIPISEAKAVNALIPSLRTWRRKGSTPPSVKPCCNSRTFSDISGCSEPRVTTYRRQARYKSRTNSCADQLHAFTKQTEHKLAVETRKIMRFSQNLAAKHRMTATRQHATGLQNQTLFTHRRFLHTDAVTHKHMYTQRLLHKHFDTNTVTQTLLHTEAFTYKHFYAQTLLHTNPLTHRRFYTQTLFAHRRFLHTDAVTHKHMYTQRLLHKHFDTNTFTHRSFYIQTLLHTDFFRRFYTQTL